MKTKVLYAITKSNWGGAQKYVYDLATNLPKDAFDVAVVFGGQGELFAQRLKDAGIRSMPIEPMQRDVKLIADLASTVGLYRVIRKEQPDILHLNSSKVSVLGSVLGRLCGVKRIVFTAHGWAFEEDRPRWQKIIFKFCYWATLTCVHETIAVSQQIRRQARAFRASDARICVIHNGISVTTHKTKADARACLSDHNQRLKVLLGEDPDTLMVATIAELHPRKGLFDAIAAYATIQDVAPKSVFTIIGEGELRDQLEEYIRNLGLQHAVFLLGHMPEAAQLLKAFDIFVLASHSEPLGYVVLEAGLASVPVIATSVGGVPEIITDESFGILVPSKSTHDLAQAVDALLRDKNRREELGNNLAYRIREFFSLDSMVTKTMRHYLLS